MKLPPPDVLATWPKPNYVDPVTRGDALLIVNIVSISLSFSVVLLRIFTRLRITGSFGTDDALIIAAMLCAVAMCVVTSLAASQYGWDRHIWDVPMSWLPTAQKLNMMFQIFFSLASTFTKLSLLWFCRRILGTGIQGPYRIFNCCLMGAMFIVASLCLAFLLITIFQCNPIHAYWDVAPTYHYHCMDDGNNVFAASVVNVFTDILTTIIPMPLIWSLKLPVRQRVIVISIFGLGLIVNAAGCVRTAFVYKSMIASYDQTWVGWPISLAGAVEINLGLICASAPALRPLLSFFLPRLLPSTRNITASSRRQGERLPKLWTSTARSKNSRLATSVSRDPAWAEDYALDRVEILRTVEVESWSESRTARHDAAHITSEAIGVAISCDDVQSKPGVPAHVGVLQVHSSRSLSPDWYQPATRLFFVDKGSI
ncbi:hypothetical protein VTN02DRAFT_1267 [Thermoascus thermophilus]